MKLTKEQRQAYNQAGLEVHLYRKYSRPGRGSAYLRMLSLLIDTAVA